MNDDELPPPLLRRKREEEFIKSRFNFLPEIMQELSHYIELSQTKNQSSNLRKSLSRLEEISEKVSQEGFNKWGSLLGILEGAKSVALEEILTIRTTIELGLNDWRAGWHITKDSSGLETSRFNAEHICSINILPSFEVPARVAILYQPTYSRIAFGVGLSPNNISSSVIQTELPNTWADPVENVLSRFDLFHNTTAGSLDGIGYDFHNLSWTSESHIRFWNPIDIQYIELEKAFFSIAEKVVDEKGQQIEKDYLVMWKKYLAR